MKTKYIVLTLALIVIVGLFALWGRRFDEEKLIKKIQVLDQIFKVSNPTLYQSLQQGVANDLGHQNPCSLWFQWKNGQKINISHDHFFLGNYRFISLTEAIAVREDFRKSAFKDVARLFGAVFFAHKAFNSWPILIDAAGDGYFFDSLSNKIFYKFEGEKDIVLSFESFVDLLTELVEAKTIDQNEVVKIELNLLSKYSR